MFNKTYNTYDSGVDFPDEINIHHHRPTTAKQIEQLREIEKEVKDNVLGMVKINDNQFNFNFFIRSSYECFDQYELIVKYKFNGNERTVSHTFERCCEDLKQAVQTLFKKVSEDIVYQYICKHCDAIEKALRGSFGGKKA
jgi:hypothetical protein